MTAARYAVTTSVTACMEATCAVGSEQPAAAGAPTPSAGDSSTAAAAGLSPVVAPVMDADVPEDAQTHVEVGRPDAAPLEEDAEPRRCSARWNTLVRRNSSGGGAEEAGRLLRQLRGVLRFWESAAGVVVAGLVDMHAAAGAPDGSVEAGRGRVQETFRDKRQVRRRSGRPDACGGTCAVSERCGVRCGPELLNSLVQWSGVVCGAPHTTRSTSACEAQALRGGPGAGIGYLWSTAWPEGAPVAPKGSVLWM